MGGGGRAGGARGDGGRDQSQHARAFLVHLDRAPSQPRPPLLHRAARGVGIELGALPRMSGSPREHPGICGEGRSWTTAEPRPSSQRWLRATAAARVGSSAAISCAPERPSGLRWPELMQRAAANARPRANLKNPPSDEWQALCPTYPLRSVARIVRTDRKALLRDPRSDPSERPRSRHRQPISVGGLFHLRCAEDRDRGSHRSAANTRLRRRHRAATRCEVLARRGLSPELLREQRQDPVLPRSLEALRRLTRSLTPIDPSSRIGSTPNTDPPRAPHWHPIGTQGPHWQRNASRGARALHIPRPRCPRSAQRRAVPVLGRVRRRGVVRDRRDRRGRLNDCHRTCASSSASSRFCVRAAIAASATRVVGASSPMRLDATARSSSGLYRPSRARSASLGSDSPSK